MSIANMMYIHYDSETFVFWWSDKQPKQIVFDRMKQTLIQHIRDGVITPPEMAGMAVMFKQTYELIESWKNDTEESEDNGGLH